MHYGHGAAHPHLHTHPLPVLVLKMGMDPTHFGIMLLLNLCIGLCTPPVGSALYVGSAIGKISIERASKGCIPFYISMLITLMMVTYIPAITMFLPNLLMPGNNGAERIGRNRTCLYKKKARALRPLPFFVGRKTLYLTALILFTTAMISAGCLS